MDHRFEQFALVIRHAQDSDGGQLHVYKDWRGLFDRMTVVDIIVESMYSGRVFGRDSLLVDAYRPPVMRDAAADAVAGAAEDAAAPVLSDSFGSSDTPGDSLARRATALIGLEWGA